MKFIVNFEKKKNNNPNTSISQNCLTKSYLPLQFNKPGIFSMTIMNI